MQLHSDCTSGYHSGVQTKALTIFRKLAANNIFFYWDKSFLYRAALVSNLTERADSFTEFFAVCVL